MQLRPHPCVVAEERDAREARSVLRLARIPGGHARAIALPGGGDCSPPRYGALRERTRVSARSTHRTVWPAAAATVCEQLPHGLSAAARGSKTIQQNVRTGGPVFAAAFGGPPTIGPIHRGPKTAAARRPQNGTEKWDRWPGKIENPARAPAPPCSEFPPPGPPPQRWAAAESTRAAAPPACPRAPLQPPRAVTAARGAVAATTDAPQRPRFATSACVLTTTPTLALCFHPHGRTPAPQVRVGLPERSCA